MSATSAIEAACAEADKTGSAYHVDLRFADGSHLNAPVVKFGANWVSVREISDEDVFVDTAGATVVIDFSPGTASATGPRFSNIQPPTPATTPSM